MSGQGVDEKLGLPASLCCEPKTALKKRKSPKPKQKSRTQKNDKAVSMS